MQPGLSRASTFLLRISTRKTWMAGTEEPGHGRRKTTRFLRRQYRAADQLALLQIGERFVGFRERQRRHRDRRDFSWGREIEQFLGFPQISDIAALDRDRLDRNQRQRPGRAAAEQADDDELADLQPRLAAELADEAGRLGKELDEIGLFGGGAPWALPLIPIKAITIQGSYVGNLRETEELLDLVRNQKIPPIPVTTLPLAKANEALIDLQKGKLVGRAVLTP